MSIFEKLFHTNKENSSDKEDKNMKIAVICANGKAGKLIVKEAQDRKLDVTAVVRGENKTEASQVITKDLFDLTAADLKGFDVVIDAFGAWTEDTLPLHSTSLKHLCDILSGTDTRLLVVGGAGSLYVNAEHTAQVMEARISRMCSSPWLPTWVRRWLSCGSARMSGGPISALPGISRQRVSGPETTCWAVRNSL